MSSFTPKVAKKKYRDCEFRHFPDGTQQFCPWQTTLQVYVERELCRPDAPERKKWHVVDRTDTVSDEDLPRLVAGPYDTAELAIFALELLYL